MRYRDFEQKIKLGSLKIFSIGKSTLGKSIEVCHVGKENGPQVLVQAGIHAREYITSLLAAKQALKLSKQTLIYGIYFVLCSNPDGVKVVLDGFSALMDFERKFCESSGYNHKLFKANANLVDLNTNFDALWGKGKANVFFPNFQNFVGPYPESEIETQVLKRFTQIVKPKLTLSYHTKGEVVYYGFDTQNKTSLERDQEMGQRIADTLGFSLERSLNSCGGFKDWVTAAYDIPSFTLEFGNENIKHPLGEENLDDLEKCSQNLFDVLGEIVVK